MKQVISLNGLWQAQGISPDGNTLSLPAKVPGMIHVDLEREGHLPNMFWRDNAEQCQWVEDWTWIYRHTFTLDPSLPLDYCVLEFGGLDTYAEIKINKPFLPERKTLKFLIVLTLPNFCILEKTPLRWFLPLIKNIFWENEWITRRPLIVPIGFMCAGCSVPFTGIG